MFRKNKQADVVRFHIRHAVYMAVVFIFLLTALLLLLANQYSLNTENEDKLLLRNFQEHISELDNLLARITTQVESMRIHAESDMMEMRLNDRIIPPLSYSFLKEADGGGSFHLDKFRDPVKQEQIGNLTGFGSLKNRDPVFYREIYMALKLNPQFRAVSRSIKEAAWIYYTSSRRFINIYPWVSSREFKFSNELFTHEFYTLGTPQKNRDRTLFWTEVYVDEYGKGLMTTCAAPVYDREDFLGSVAVDLTVDFLNTKVKKFRAEKGVMFLVNDRNQLLAHPSLITSHDKRTKTMIEALPEDLRPAYSSILKAPNKGSHTLNGYKLLHSTLKYAPWQAYYFEFKPSLWKSFINRVGLGALILLFALLIMMIVMMIVTHRNFVVPSGKLVNFIIKRNKRDFTGDYESVPRVWRPWFSAVDNAFRENDELTHKIRKQNEELEERVKVRTAELVASNQKLLVEIEERTQAEQEKQKLQTHLQRAQKMEAIGMLAGGVAHDLNNVLAGLVSYPQLLLMDLAPDSPLRNPILTIQKSGEKAAAIVQDLLTLARRGVAVNEIVNLNSLISDYMKSPEYKGLMIHHPDIEVKAELDKELLNISGSPVHLSKCMMNLIINAAESMPQGGHICLATKNQYIDQPISKYDEIEEGDYVTFIVSDQGVGISPEDLERIFEPFYTKKMMGRSGTGLGMAVVWGVVKDHKGYIDIQSVPGKGTTFTLFFPATREEAVKEVTSINLDDYKGHEELILVADDVVEQREIGARMLKKLGYKVDTVSSGEEAVEYMRKHSPDLIVLDMIMDPGIDGLETYKRILDISPGQKAIIASGFSETDRVREAQRLGAGAYVKKPFLMEKIAVAIRKELEEEI